jgi:hypothetical protein
MHVRVLLLALACVGLFAAPAAVADGASDPAGGRCYRIGLSGIHFTIEVDPDECVRTLGVWEPNDN